MLCAPRDCRRTARGTRQRLRRWTIEDAHRAGSIRGDTIARLLQADASVPPIHRPSACALRTRLDGLRGISRAWPRTGAPFGLELPRTNGSTAFERNVRETPRCR